MLFTIATVVVTVVFHVTDNDLECRLILTRKRTKGRGREESDSVVFSVIEKKNDVVYQCDGSSNQVITRNG